MPLIKNRYGKGRVRVMRVNRDGERHEVNQLNVKAMVEGDFARTYTHADNTRTVSTDTIKNVVNIVKDNIQKRDLFARWGGEEFLLVFPGTQASEARLIAERLRELIAEDEPASGLRVTSSFGVAEWLPGEELTQSIARADSAMYRAKELGRNRVETEPA